MTVPHARLSVAGNSLFSKRRSTSPSSTSVYDTSPDMVRCMTESRAEIPSSGVSSWFRCRRPSPYLDQGEQLEDASSKTEDPAKSHIHKLVKVSSCGKYHSETSLCITLLAWIAAPGSVACASIDSRVVVCFSM